MIIQPVVMQTLNQEDYGIAFSDKHKAIGEKFDKAIAEMKQNGELDALYQKWFNTNSSESNH
jgi:ABC-type amino acid transport substrate-binding protein